MKTQLITWLDAPDVPQVALVGGKGRSLHMLSRLGLAVPYGFILTTAAYRDALPTSLVREIDRRLTAITNEDHIGEVDETASQVRELLYGETEKHPARSAISEAYARLGERLDDAFPPVAVRSSSAAEDSRDHSFAGQHDSYLWVVGEDKVSDAVRRCWASLFTARSISYRSRRSLSAADDAMAVVVQQMVDARTAGVFMTVNPANGDRSKVVIESVWGLGEPLVSGTATPDRFVVDKVTREIVEQTVATKVTRAVRDRQSGRGFSLRGVGVADQRRPSLTANEVNYLVDVARRVELNEGCPQDGEFAVDGAQVYVLQARPETVWRRRHPPSGDGVSADALSQVVNVVSGYQFAPWN